MSRETLTEHDQAKTEIFIKVFDKENIIRKIEIKKLEIKIECKKEESKN